MVAGFCRWHCPSRSPGGFFVPISTLPNHEQGGGALTFVGPQGRVKNIKSGLQAFGLTAAGAVSAAAIPFLGRVAQRGVQSQTISAAEAQAAGIDLSGIPQPLCVVNPFRPMGIVLIVGGLSLVAGIFLARYLRA